MFQKISSSFEKYSESNAFCIQDVFFTYRELGKRINGIVSILKAVKSTNIGIIAHDDIETYASVLAVLFSGKTYVPVNPAYPGERIQNMLEQAEIDTVLTSKIADTENIFSDQNKYDFISTFRIQYAWHTLHIPDVSAENKAYILFTSGSTGIPKGVPISYKNLDAFCDAFFAQGFDMNENDRVLQMVDLTFDLSVMSFLMPLCAGACVYTVPPGDIKFAATYSILEKHRITFAMMVPSILGFLKNYFSEIRLEDMRYSLFCGEALYAGLAKQWAKCIPNAAIFNVYGPTEATVFCMAYELEKKEAIKEKNDIVCLGKTMKNTLAMIVDENLSPVSDGTYGELCLSGAQLTRGYIKNPLKNNEVFFKYVDTNTEHLFYRTGDICCKDADGNFFYKCRLDDQIKIQGYRVELGEVEFYARKFTNDKNAAAIACPDTSGKTIIRLYVENFIQKKELEDYLRAKLPAYMIPSEIISINIFPLNAHGKTDKKALLKMINC